MSSAGWAAEAVVGGSASAGYDGHDVARRVPEPDKATPARRTPFERDRARVLHSSALRRLAAKTQVVGPGEDDFPRTRLTHSLECAQIGRELAAALGADPDLVDAACLAHDLGHPPFGHNGETALDQAAASCGGFEGNAQSLRELTRLEPKVLDAGGRSAGLNLTRATLDAATKYPWPRRAGVPKFGVYDDDRPIFDWLRRGAPEGRRCLEASVMDWADDVAYSVHDLEDGVHSGLVDLSRLDDTGERRALVALTGELCGPADAGALERLRTMPWWLRGPADTLSRLAGLKAMTSELIARFCVATVRATRHACGDGPLSRYGGELVVPTEMAAECAVLKGLTVRFVMARPGAAVRQERQRELVRELVALLVDRAPSALDAALRPAWREAGDDADRLRVVVDQVARLTDTSAVRRHAQLRGS